MSTNPEELPYRQMTALEIAKFNGFEHLYEVLTPKIHHVVPAATLGNLPERLHSLVIDNMQGRPERFHLRLNVLTSLEVPEMWFPAGQGSESPASVMEMTETEGVCHPPRWARTVITVLRLCKVGEAKVLPHFRR